jgi:hypothetical protein
MMWLAWIVCPIVGAFIGNARGRALGGFLAGLLLGPLGLIVAFMLKPMGRECASCRGIVPAQATKCLHCGSDLAA